MCTLYIHMYKHCHTAQHTHFVYSQFTCELICQKIVDFVKHKIVSGRRASAADTQGFHKFTIAVTDEWISYGQPLEL